MPLAPGVRLGVYEVRSLLGAGGMGSACGCCDDRSGGAASREGSFAGGGTRPLWARNGQELFYRSPTGAVMSVRIERGATWAASTPTKLFEGRYFVGGGGGLFGRTYDVALDGRRFLMIKLGGGGSDETAAPASLIVVQNWLEELKRLVPSKQ